ncbi:unnamed protein product [Protopolystoma xenopodis]|uniref:Uncharacterized protein n=1 Tax=Protopolystoma xenopodis TaxID=117903 RepID=A0A3S5B913_9PLAT|nr:unnamed protein product [Protopolystoma xenopodis]
MIIEAEVECHLPKVKMILKQLVPISSLQQAASECQKGHAYKEPGPDDDEAGLSEANSISRNPQALTCSKFASSGNKSKAFHLEQGLTPGSGQCQDPRQQGPSCLPASNPQVEDTNEFRKSYRQKDPLEESLTEGPELEKAGSDDMLFDEDWVGVMNTSEFDLTISSQSLLLEDKGGNDKLEWIKSSKTHSENANSGCLYSVQVGQISLLSAELHQSREDPESQGIPQNMPAILQHHGGRESTGESRTTWNTRRMSSHPIETTQLNPERNFTFDTKQSFSNPLIDAPNRPEQVQFSINNCPPPGTPSQLGEQRNCQRVEVSEDAPNFQSPEDHREATKFNQPYNRETSGVQSQQTTPVVGTTMMFSRSRRTQVPDKYSSKTSKFSTSCEDNLTFQSSKGYLSYPNQVNCIPVRVKNENSIDRLQMQAE